MDHNVGRTSHQTRQFFFSLETHFLVLYSRISQYSVSMQRHLDECTTVGLWSLTVVTFVPDYANLKE
jgi:hypothetical protein